MNATHAHRSAVADKGIDPFYSQHIFKFPVGNESGMQHHTAVIQLLVLGKDKAERVGSRQDDFHAAAGIDIGEKCRPFDKIVHQRDLVQKHIPIPLLLQIFQVSIYCG